MVREVVETIEAMRLSFVLCLWSDCLRYIVVIVSFWCFGDVIDLAVICQEIR